tara:strand:- start:1076 stop:2032 length:957 start_codon:yes stop_codon:yes gene_type:complete
MLLITSLCAPGLAALQLQASRRTFTPPDEPSVLVDLRPREAYASCHLEGSSSLPLAQLATELFTLPPPGEWPMALVGSREQIAEAQALLQPKGWTAAELEADDASSLRRHGYRTVDGHDSAPTWRPNSFLAAVLRSQPVMPPAGVAVDVGCGSGRDAVHLSQELGADWSVVGVDNHGGALDRGRQLARAVGQDVVYANANIRKQTLAMAVAESLGADGTSEAAKLQLVHGCRFLHLPLLENLGEETLAPDGLLIWSTFLEGCELIAPPFKPSRRLGFGQLRALCGEASGFEVLCDEQGELLTRGKWVPAQFYAARRVR